MNPMLLNALIHVGGDGAASQIFKVFLWILIGLILWWLGKTFFPKLGMPPIGMQVWDGLFILIAAVVVINFLAGLAGHQFIAW